MILLLGVARIFSKNRSTKLESIFSSGVISEVSERPKGWIYAATMENTVGVIKVGYTEGSPDRRIEQWSTGQPGPAHLEYAALVEDPLDFEGRVHKELLEFRTQGEWFRCDLETVVSAIQESGTVLYTDDRRAGEDQNQFRPSPEEFAEMLQSSPRSKYPVVLFLPYPIWIIILCVILVLFILSSF